MKTSNLSEKKNGKKYHLNLSIGLTLALALVIMAFEWPATYIVKKIDFEYLHPLEEVLVIQPTEIEPPRPPQPKKEPKIEQIINPEPEPDFLETPLTPVPDIETAIEDILNEGPPTEVVDDRPFFLPSESQASFPGGIEAWYDYLRKSIKYPRREKNMGIEGKVTLKFVVDKTGIIDQIEVIKSAGENFDNEAIRVLMESPPFIPGRQGEVPVKSWMVTTISFRVQ